MELLGIEGNCS